MNELTTAKMKQKFGFTAPASTSVRLVGDFTHWEQNAISLKKQSNGRWETTVSLSPGTYHYRFLVDGQWCDDPECTLHVPNPFGGHNDVRKVA